MFLAVVFPSESSLVDLALPALAWLLLCLAVAFFALVRRCLFLLLVDVSRVRFPVASSICLGESFRSFQDRLLSPGIDPCTSARDRHVHRYIARYVQIERSSSEKSHLVDTYFSTSSVSSPVGRKKERTCFGIKLLYFDTCASLDEGLGI